MCRRKAFYRRLSREKYGDYGSATRQKYGDDRSSATRERDTNNRRLLAKGVHYNLSFLGPSHNHPLWSAIPEIVREV